MTDKLLYESLLKMRDGFKYAKKARWTASRDAVMHLYNHCRFGQRMDIFRPNFECSHTENIRRRDRNRKRG